MKSTPVIEKSNEVQTLKIAEFDSSIKSFVLNEHSYINIFLNQFINKFSITSPKEFINHFLNDIKYVKAKRTSKVINFYSETTTSGFSIKKYSFIPFQDLNLAHNLCCHLYLDVAVDWFTSLTNKNQYNSENINIFLHLTNSNLINIFVLSFNCLFSTQYENFHSILSDFIPVTSLENIQTVQFNSLVEKYNNLYKEINQELDPECLSNYSLDYTQTFRYKVFPYDNCLIGSQDKIEEFQNLTTLIRQTVYRNITFTANTLVKKTLTYDVNKILSHYLTDLDLNTSVKNPFKVSVSELSEKQLNSIINSPIFKEKSIPCSRWNYTATHPLTLDLNLRNEMLEKVKQHLSGIPDLKIIHLSLRKLAYFSDGSRKNTPDAINHKDTNIFHTNNFYEFHNDPSNKPAAADPCIYLGDAWCLYFETSKYDFLQAGSMIYFCTPEQFVDAYKDKRPDLIENFEPWSDLMFISSDFCERNGSENYRFHIDLQTPHRKRLSLYHWIATSLFSRYRSHGHNIDFVQNFNGYDHEKNRQDRLKRFKEKALSLTQKFTSDLNEEPEVIVTPA
jgi:hypothetical protein